MSVGCEFISGRVGLQLRKMISPVGEVAFFLCVNAVNHFKDQS